MMDQCPIHTDSDLSTYQKPVQAPWTTRKESRGGMKGMGGK